MLYKRHYFSTHCGICLLPAYSLLTIMGLASFKNTNSNKSCHLMIDEIMLFDLKMEKICSKNQLDWAQVHLCTQGKTGESWRCILGIYLKCYQISSLCQFLSKNFLRKVTITKMGQNNLGTIALHPPIAVFLSSFSSFLYIHFPIHSYTFVLFTQIL